MSLPPSTSKKSYTPNLNKIGGSKKGKLYEIIALLTLAKKGFELSIDENTKFRDFCIGREVGIGKYRKFDDVVFSYVDQANRNNLIFLQLKHCQYRDLIDSSILSTEADRAKDVAAKTKVSATRVGDVQYGYMCKYFNLQQYFISFLSARDELANTNTEELKDGKIKYIVLFTNSDLDIEELKGKGFSFNKAPGDIVDLLTLSSETEHHCYQLGDMSKDLRKILEKSSDLDRLARELARYVVYEDYRENRVMGIQETPIKYYHVALEREVMQKSTLKQVENGQYFREAQFRDEFLDCDQTAPNLHQLRKALFEAIRDLDESKKGADDDELKRVIKQAKWKTVYNCEKSIQTNFPCEWIPVRDDDIKDFLRCFVFIVNQPTVTEFELLYKQSIQSVVVENTSLKQFVEQINATGPEFRDCVEKVFGLDIKPHNNEKWIPRNQIVDFMENKKQLLQTIFVVSAMTLSYKIEIMQYGEFIDFGKIIENVKNFLISDWKVLCVNSPVTLLSSIKISQHLNIGKKYPISVSLNILNCTKKRDCVLKAFELESISLLTIECTHAFKDQDVNFLYELVNIAKKQSNKKIILIMKKENYVIFGEHFKTEDKEICVVENDSINLKYFEPKEDPLAKKVLVFQGQKEKVSLSDMTGINSWNSYVDNLTDETSEQGIIDGMAFIEILSKHEIEVGSKPAGTSSVEGAYAHMYEEINVENLVNKLTSQEHGNDTNDMYIISGITGSSKQDKSNKLIQYLGLSNNKKIIQDQLEDIGSDSKIQIADDTFKNKYFQGLCHLYPEKRIFWICVKCEKDGTKFILLEIYNPKFYLKRKFQNVIIKKDLKQFLFKDGLSETFIFCCVEDKEQLYKSIGLNVHEIEKFEDNCKIKIFFQKRDAETCFKQLYEQNETVHLLEFEKQQFVWCESHGSVKSLKKYIDYKQCEIFLIEEDKLIKRIKDRKVVILADDPGMGKSTTLVKLYETEIESSSIIKSHWVMDIKLRDHLEAVRGLKFKKDGIGIVNVVEFLTKIDLKLNNNLAKNLLKITLDKSKNFKSKTLLLAFDGFDEVLDDQDRNLILLLLKFIKNETAAKIWISTRLHFRWSLEEALSTIAFQFYSLEDKQKIKYTTQYLQLRLYLILNEKKYTDLFDNSDKQDNKGILPMYITEFFIKMKSIFKGDISRFIGTPLQLHLMLEVFEEYFKNSLESNESENPDFNDVYNDIWEVYENFIDRKYYVYFQKVGIPKGKQRRQEKIILDQLHENFAKFKVLELKPKKLLHELWNKILLVGIIKSDGNDPNFIHKTFEEFFASKLFIHWIQKEPNKFSNINKRAYLSKVILMRDDYQLIRIFMELQLQKITEETRKCSEKLVNKKRRPFIDQDGTPLLVAVEKSIEAIIAHFLFDYLKIFSFDFKKHASENIPNELLLGRNHRFILTFMDEYLQKITKKGCFIAEDGTPLHVAVEEGNKRIASFLLNSLRKYPYVLKEFLFMSVEPNEWCTNISGTALHLACERDDVEVVKVLLDAAAEISEETLHEFLACENCEIGDPLSAFEVAAANKKNIDIFKELFSRANNKPDLILIWQKAFRLACDSENEKILEYLLQEFKQEDSLKKDSLKKLLLCNSEYSSALSCSLSFKISTDSVQKLICAAESMEDNNETLKKLLFPEEDEVTLNSAIVLGRTNVAEMLLNVAEEIKDDNHTLKQLLLNERRGESSLHIAAKRGLGDIIKILLKTASDVSIEMLEEFIFAVDENDKNAIQLMFENGHEKIFADSFKMLEEDKYQNIWKKIKGMFDNVLLESRLCWDKKQLFKAIYNGDVKKVIDILSNAKNSVVSPNERRATPNINSNLRSLLLAIDEFLNNTLCAAYIRGDSAIIKELISYAKAIGDDNRTLKQMLFYEICEVSALHYAARMGCGEVIKQLLESVPDLGIETLEELLFAVGKRGKNAIQLMSSKGLETIQGYFFKMLQEDKYQNSWEKIKEMSDNVKLERSLCLDMEQLTMAIYNDDIEKVEDILSKAKNGYDDNHTLKQLLLDKRCGESALHVATERGRCDIKKLLLKTAADIGIKMSNIIQV